ncbi:hypothetical protein QBC38DRAFT_262852 [Podospora fimiseda]|uniref:Fungal N-terminal domain-containing protein n=1 Tax=Podospora fimiseda TaxID=252190 RepID=A0AAN7BLH1_9PEZI|nr:hypothetical protein QBC38DRAFT_262852 [Podospora fimiseda]
MGSPISFGDAVAMSKIAWNIAQALSKGRKSAPAEIRQVEKQLKSLSSTLAAFQTISANDSDVGMTQEAAATLKRMLEDCNETLSHLQQIVDKYVHVTDANRSSTQSGVKRLGSELFKNYKKIIWVKEAGDLATLRSQLLLHTNSLGLILGIIINSRTSRLEENLKLNLSKLTDVHEWWTKNLKNSQPIRPASARDDTECSYLTFRVSVVTDSGPNLLCSRACLREDFETQPSPLFACNCGPAKPHKRLEDIALSRTSFPFRQTGVYGSWTLYRVLDKSTNRLITITICISKVTDIQEFEYSFVKTLSEAGAEAMLEQGLTNHLVHPTPDMQGVRILNLQSYLKQLSKLVTKVEFRVGHRSLCKDGIDSLNLLHYREIRGEDAGQTNRELEYAELLIYYSSSNSVNEGDITSNSLHLKYGTKHRLFSEDMSVVIEEVECLGFMEDTEISRLKKANITIKMANLDAAVNFHQKLKEMAEELFIMTLATPGPDDVAVFYLPATQVECDVVSIQEAELVITRDKTGNSRLIVTSSNGCTVLVQNLRNDFFTSTSKSPNFASPTWLIQVDMNESQGNYQRKVIPYPNGFRFLSFHNAKCKSL